MASPFDSTTFTYMCPAPGDSYPGSGTRWVPGGQAGDRLQEQIDELRRRVDQSISAPADLPERLRPILEEEMRKMVDAVIARLKGGK